MGDAPRFTPELLARRPPGGMDVLATLEHFAIVSYAVPPERLRPHLHSRFAPDTFPGPDGRPRVLVSAVPFEDQDFRLAVAPRFTFRFGQTNYRTYVVDRVTGRRAVWFFGTTLDSWSVCVPRYVWRLPWHRGRMAFDCAHDGSRYTRYRMRTRSRWAPVELDLEDGGRPVDALVGYPDLEAGLVVLTHPLVGVFHFRGSREVGTYGIWHDRLRCTVGRVVRARWGLFDRLGLVPFAEQGEAHSVLLQRRTEFTIYLPPGRLV